jgi:hypothetical protein
MPIPSGEVARYLYSNREAGDPMLQNSLVTAMLLFTPVFALADEHVQKDHATVHIVLVVPYEMRDTGGAGGGMGALGGLTAQTSVERAVVGDVVLPTASINPISISIDGEFVGHAMTGMTSIKPVFVLPHGKHKFEFSSDVFKTTKVEMTIIGTGSKQYLIVKLPPATEVSDGPKPNAPPNGKYIPTKG